MQWQGPTGEINGLAGFRQAAVTAPGAKAFADTRMIIHDMIAEGDTVTVRYLHSPLKMWDHSGATQPQTNRCHGKALLFIN